MSEITRFNKKSPKGGQGTYTLNVGNSVVLFSSVTPPTGANYVEMRVEKADATTSTVVMRHWNNGETVTAGSGFPMANMDIFAFSIEEWTNLQFHSVDANTQKLWFKWYQV